LDAMGNCARAAHKTEESTQIERFIAAEKKKADKVIRLLILGAGDSGKTTMCKHFQMLAKSFRDSDRELYRSALRASLIQYMRLLVQACQCLGHEIEDHEMCTCLFNTEAHLTPELAKIIRILWEAPAIQETFKKRNLLFTLPDSCAVLFGRVEEIADADFRCSDADCLLIRLRTVGVTEFEVPIPPCLLRIVDVGGQRNARRKWIHQFERTHGLLYCIALDDYAMLLAEDLQTNRCLESLKLFQDVNSIAVLRHLPLIIFFNKVDMLHEKIKTTDLSAVFTEYKGGPDPQAALKFIQDMYLKAVSPSRTSYVHVTNALDNRNVQFVFESVKDVFMTSLLNNMGV